MVATRSAGDATGTSLPRGLRAVITEVRGEDPELASYLRSEERELEAGGVYQWSSVLTMAA